MGVGGVAIDSNKDCIVSLERPLTLRLCSAKRRVCVENMFGIIRAGALHLKYFLRRGDHL